MGRNPDRVIDKTHLSIDTAEERNLIHRDYIAHCLRWSHVAKHLQGTYKDSFVLDVGCGKELPLAKMLYSNRLIPRKYVGVDVNDLDIPQMLEGKKIPVSVWTKTDFCALTPEDLDGEKADVITCFEVLEHVTPEHARRLARHIRDNLKPKTGRAFISTPCWNGSAAGNHINEMTFKALGTMLWDIGFIVENVHGTFASIRDYEHLLGPSNDTYKYTDDSGELQVGLTLRGAFQGLREYYDTNFLAVVFAPLFPENSRNCIWTLSTDDDRGSQAGLESQLLSLDEKPWSQHPLWRELSGLTDEEARKILGDDDADADSDAEAEVVDQVLEAEAVDQVSEAEEEE